MTTLAEARDRCTDRFRSMGAGRSLAAAYAAVLVEAYNYKMKNTLPPFTKAASISNSASIAGTVGANLPGRRNPETGRLQ